MATQTTTGEMFELLAMHWSDLMNQDVINWDKAWELPLYLIEGDPSWDVHKLEWAWDYFHNGPSHVR